MRIPLTATAIPIAAALIVAAAPPPISPARIKADVTTLASDDFAGRGPGEIGEARTLAFLAKAFADAGLQPGANGGWLQDVPLVRLDRAPGAAMVLTTAGKTMPLALGRDATLALRNPGHTATGALPLVFAGFGLVDPAHGQDPFNGIDMAGKIAVMLANDPDFDTGKDMGFEGRRLVLGGRFGSKVAAAARAGAIGVLVIHEDAAASYPWLQVGSGDALPAFVPAPLQAAALQFSGWLSGETAATLLQSAGLDLATLKARSRAPGFRAFPLPGATVAADGTLTARAVTSHNVVGIIPGSRAEYVLYGAHWDANGLNGPDATGDTIRNGAIDNATGTAELIEIARALAKGPKPQRSIVFAAWTSEEKGLLGSDYYAGHPLYPLATTAAVINLDPHVVLPAARNLELVGGGRTTLETDLATAAKQLGLRVDDEPNPEAGWYFRSDHYPFAARGVPALSFRAGRDLKSGGFTTGNALVTDYNNHRYHQPSDSIDPAWTFEGTAQEASAALLVGQSIANSAQWPQWNFGSDYAPIRAATAAQRPPPR